MQEITIGYWRDSSHPEFPWPRDNTPGPQQTEVIKRLEEAMSSGHMIKYRGWSNCRLCGKENGSQELEIIKDGIKYRIPQGYVHYLKEHNVGYDPKILLALEDD